jgi:hypothetical protein
MIPPSTSTTNQYSRNRLWQMPIEERIDWVIHRAVRQSVEFLDIGSSWERCGLAGQPFCTSCLAGC